MPSLILQRARFRVPTLEECLTEPEWFGLTTASALQRAICRILDGLPLGELAKDPGVIGALGGAAAVEQLPATKCAELVLLAGVRSGKSLLASLVVARAAMSCDVSGLGPGEVVSVPIVSLTLREAGKTFNHIRGRILASPRLRQMLIEKPLSDSLLLRHPNGRPICIRVTAGTRAAGSLLGDWCGGAVFDEATRMLGEEDGVVNLDEARTAVAPRLLPGAQIILSGSSNQPYGPVYDLVTEFHGKPSKNLVVIRATGPVMNPRHWTPERCEELRQRDPDAYAVDVMTQFRDAESGIFAEPELRLCCREKMDCQPDPKRHYIAAMDAGTRGNSWTLAVASRDTEKRLRVDLVYQWTGSGVSPLSPREVFTEMAPILAPYRVRSIMADEWSADALRDIASEFGLWLKTENMSRNEKNEGARVLRDRVTERRIELPPNDVMIRDLCTMKKRVDEQGHKIVLPQTRDGRHCDYVPALLKIAVSYMREPEPDELPSLGTSARDSIDRAAEKEAARLEVEKRNRERGKRWGRAGGWP